MEAADDDWLHKMDKKQLLDAFNMFLAARAREGVFTVLIIDEAQNTSAALLEQLRLVSNYETAKSKLLQIIFVGQLEFNKILNAPDMRQLNQRISTRFKSKPLSKTDTELYIRHRLAKAGGGSKIRFRKAAFKIVRRYSKGCPRLINLICDRALLAAYGERSLLITPKHIRRAALSLQGREYSSMNIVSGWFRRRYAFFVPAALLLAAVFFITYRSLAG